ncbi:hypothetical protein J2R98_000251 [Alkalibacillus filiformis]|uniref:Uncharacterized protein n=1 Tax=Alkalibacillus filiformis TaxID=200990 RepID=A0ABU0DPR3_9BACI|nr:hypothetical protein [Alkalibacillus filiformis]
MLKRLREKIKNRLKRLLRSKQGLNTIDINKD